MKISELNQLVCEKVFGNPQGKAEESGRFSPATNISDAWTVLDTVCEKHNWRAIIDRNQEYTEVTFKNQMGGWIQYFGEEKTAPIAICKAVLETVGIEIEEDVDMEMGEKSLIY